MSLIKYFINRPVVANVLMFGLILMAVVFWQKIGKEEMPEFAMEWVRVSLRYPGASAEDVEVFVTKPIEEKLKGLTGLKEVSTTSSFSSSSFRVSFEPNLGNLQEKIQEVKDAVESAILPSEVQDPVYRQFRSSEKAIIDVGIYLEGDEILNVETRTQLQKYALAFKNKILSQPEISGVESTGYLKPELQIKVIPERLEKYEISMNQVKAQVLEKNIRTPIGSLEDDKESEVSIVSELDTVSSLNEVIISSGFRGQRLRLSDVAKIENGYEKNNTVTKVQGHEAIIFNIQKSSNTDILSAQKAVVSFIERFKKSNQDSNVRFVLIDDESYDVRNRLALIGSNGVIGFILIVLVLFLFLDFKSGIWVAMGIPFSLGFTILMAMLIGFTVNNMTLAAIIVVLGIVVDDAIIVAENIVRRVSNEEATPTESVVEVIGPILASILTTCAAFIPLYFFSGRFGLFVKYIPTIIFFMLLASLIESFFILPSHMVSHSFIERWFQSRGPKTGFKNFREKAISRAEELYAKTLKRLLKFRVAILLVFIAVLSGAFYIFSQDMKYVMFPREESRDFRVKAVADEGTTRYEMARKIKQIEDLFAKHPTVTSVRSSIGQSRRGGQVKENEASLRVEILPPSERKESLKSLMEKWQTQIDQMEGLKEVRFQKSRFGSDSGSPIVIEVQENNDENRQLIVGRLKEELEKVTSLANVEVERPVVKREFRLKIKKEEASRLNVDYSQMSSVLRSYIEGDILYTLNSGEEEVDVRFTSQNNSKDSVNDLLKLTVANQSNYLVPLRGLVEVIEGKKDANIQRVNFKRTTSIYADLAAGTKQTPLEIAAHLEENIFDRVTEGMPSALLKFRGEVEDSREAQSDFALSITMVLLIIYVLLVFLFDSLWTPFLIGAIIPFGVVGTVMAFWAHGMSQYGFFAVVGTLGMIGVVINDSIVLIDKLNASLKSLGAQRVFEQISEITSTRLRAVFVTTVTTVAGLFPTAYGLGGYDSMLSEMMLAMGWGLLFGMFITLLLVPCLYSFYAQLKVRGSKC